jgi:hypothetical protein
MGSAPREGKHQFTVNWNSIPIADLLYVTIGTTVRSGTLFTPMIAGDVNGDGYLNDRAFIFDPSSAADTSLAASMRSLLAVARPQRASVSRASCGISRGAPRVSRRG